MKELEIQVYLRSGKSLLDLTIEYNINVFDSVDAEFNSEDVNKLEEHLEKNISIFKNLIFFTKN